MEFVLELLFRAYKDRLKKHAVAQVNLAVYFHRSFISNVFVVWRRDLHVYVNQDADDGTISCKSNIRAVRETLAILVAVAENSESMER